MDEKKLKVLFISAWYPTMKRPYLGIFVQRHAEAIADLCHTAAVYASSDNSAGIEMRTLRGVVTINSYYKKKSLKLLSLFSYVLAWKKAIKLYKKENGKPDIIHANIVFPASIIAAWYSFLWKVPYVVTEQWTGYFPEDGRYRGWFLKTMSAIGVRRALAVMTVSAALKNKMIEAKLFNTYHVISNIVDTNIFSISLKSHSNIRFIHASFPDGDRKNIPGIIRAFHTFHEKWKDATLTLIVGEGKDIESLQTLCTSLDLRNAVSFLSWKTKEELADLLHDSDAFVLFSDVETQGIVLLETMCCGLPVITSRCGAPEEFVTPKNGLLVDIRNEQQLAEAMNTIAQNKDKYNPTEVRNSVVNMVSTESVARRFLEIYNEVLKSK